MTHLPVPGLNFAENQDLSYIHVIAIGIITYVDGSPSLTIDVEPFVNDTDEVIAV